MKAVLLAAGYATRLYPLTLTQPKSLLPVAGRPMIEHVLADLATIDGLEHVHVVVNERFSPNFQRWLERHGPSTAGVPLSLFNDGSTSDAGKRGAVGGLKMAIDQLALDDDLVVLAADNLFSHSLADFGRLGRAKQAPVLGVYDVGTLDQAKKYGVVGLDPSGRITSFLEKPEVPVSTLVGVALYFFPKATLPLIGQYVAGGNHPHHPGRFIQWLHPRTPVYAWSVPGTWYDIGSKETLEEVSRIFTAQR